MSEKDTAHEREMARINNSVVKIHNISDEDFEHTFDGIPYSIGAGETLPFVYPVGMLLAKHLAMRIVRTKAKTKGELAGNDDKKARNLYTKDALRPLLEQIVVETIERPVEVVESEGKKLQRKTKELQDHFKGQNAKKTETQPSVDLASLDKKEIIKTLNDRKIKFDARATKEQLLELVVASEMKGEDEEETEADESEE